MKMPIICLETKGVDAIMFATLKGVAKYLEPIDVLNKEYIVFDSEGNPLDLKVEGGKIHITKTEGTQNCAAELIEALRKYLLLIDVSEELLKDADLNALINLARQKCEIR